MLRARSFPGSATVVAVVLIAASVLGWWFGAQRRAADAQYRVVQVLDGDTIVVARGDVRDTIRLLGIDTPETHHPTKPVQCYGPEASDYTTARLQGSARAPGRRRRDPRHLRPAPRVRLPARPPLRGRAAHEGLRAPARRSSRTTRTRATCCAKSSTPSGAAWACGARSLTCGRRSAEPDRASVGSGDAGEPPRSSDGRAPWSRSSSRCSARRSRRPH